MHLMTKLERLNKENVVSTKPIYFSVTEILEVCFFGNRGGSEQMKWRYWSWRFYCSTRLTHTCWMTQLARQQSPIATFISDSTPYKSLVCIFLLYTFTITTFWLYNEIKNIYSGVDNKKGKKKKFDAQTHPHVPNSDLPPHPHLFFFKAPNNKWIKKVTFKKYHKNCIPCL